MVIWFESHATSLDNEARLASGWHDVALSPLGERQARELGERYRTAEIAAVYCSDLRRARDTARLAFEGRDLPIVGDRRLRECDYGALTRHTLDEVEARRALSVHLPFPGGESYADVTGRVSAWLREAASAHADRTILVIGHRATFHALEHLCLGVALADSVAAPWRWQPGWRFEFGSEDGGAGRPRR